MVQFWWILGPQGQPITSAPGPGSPGTTTGNPAPATPNAPPAKPPEVEPPPPPMAAVEVECVTCGTHRMAPQPDARGQLNLLPCEQCSGHTYHRRVPAP